MRLVLRPLQRKSHGRPFSQAAVRVETRGCPKRRECYPLQAAAISCASCSTWHAFCDSTNIVVLSTYNQDFDWLPPCSTLDLLSALPITRCIFCRLIDSHLAVSLLFYDRSVIYRKPGWLLRGQRSRTVHQLWSRLPCLCHR